MAAGSFTPNPLDFLSSTKGTQFLPGGGFSPFQGSIHFAPGRPLPPGSIQGLTGSDFAISIQKTSLVGLLLPAAQEAGEQPKPSESYERIGPLDPTITWERISH